jgi:hypothetical protein
LINSLLSLKSAMAISLNHSPEPRYCGNGCAIGRTAMMVSVA